MQLGIVESTTHIALILVSLIDLYLKILIAVTILLKRIFRGALEGK